MAGLREHDPGEGQVKSATRGVWRPREEPDKSKTSKVQNTERGPRERPKERWTKREIERSNSHGRSWVRERGV